VSQSPNEHSTAKEVLAYDKGWAATNMLIRSGRSFSGRERNCCFLNLGDGKFANVSSATGLNLIDDGRALALTDWDFDGDIDFWIYNRTGPRVRYLRNDITTNNHFVAVRLQGTTCNRDAIGARVELYTATSGDSPLLKSLRAGEGFLTQSTKWLHFGLGSESQIERMVVRWPGGEAETFSDIKADTQSLLIQGEGKAIRWTPATQPQPYTASTPAAPSLSGKARVVVLKPAPMPSATYSDLDGKQHDLANHSGGPLLVNLWETTCAPCIKELLEWKEHHQELEEKGLQIVALCVDRNADGQVIDPDSVRQFVQRLKLPFKADPSQAGPFKIAPFRVGIPNSGLVEALEVVQRTFIGKQTPLPVPCSFLLDGDGQVAVIYKGPVSIEQLSSDLKILGAPSADVVAAAIPFSGHWLEPPQSTSSGRSIALKYINGGYHAEGEAYLQRLLAWYEQQPSESAQVKIADIHSFLGAIMFDRKEPEKAILAFESALAITPGNRLARLELIRALRLLGRSSDAAEHLEIILADKRDDPENLAALATLQIELRQTDEAIKLLRESLELRDNGVAHYHLARALLSKHQLEAAVIHYRHAIRVRPDWIPPMNDLAWILATFHDESIRNGVEAVEIAEEVCRLAADPGPSPSLLSTLAVAHAEAGQFEAAIAQAQRALELARKVHDDAMAKKLAHRIELFESRKPYHDPAPQE